MSDVTGKPFGDIYAYIDRQIAAAVLAAATDHQTLSHRLRPHDGHDLYPRVDGARGMDSGANLEQGRAPVTDLETATRAWVLSLIPTVLDSAFTHLATGTVAGSAATSIAFTSGIDLSVDEGYFIRCKLQNATAGSIVIRLQVNNDTTGTNYYGQLHTASSTTNSTSRGNNSDIVQIAANADVVIWIWMQKDLAGRPRAYATCNREAAASIAASTRWWIHNSTTNVTRIDIISDTANSLSVGSSVEIFSIKAV